MKNAFLLLAALLLLVVASSAQETKVELLTSKVWTLKNQIMIGIGTHKPILDGTEVFFTANGKWKSSQPIEGETEGNWKLSDNKLEMTFGSKEESIKYKLTFLNTTSLNYKTFLKTAQYTFEWTAI